MSAKKSRKWLMIIYPETKLINTKLLDKLTDLGMPGFISPIHTPGTHNDCDVTSIYEDLELEENDAETFERTPKDHIHVYLEYSGPTTEAHIHALVATALDLPLDAIPLMLPCANEKATWDYFTHAHQPDKQQFAYGNTVFGGYRPPQTDETVTQTVRTVIKIIKRDQLQTLSQLLMCDAPDMTPDVVAWICAHAYLCDKLLCKSN